jgi:hypothetical protein
MAGELNSSHTKPQQAKWNCPLGSSVIPSPAPPTRVLRACSLGLSTEKPGSQLELKTPSGIL